VRCCQTAYDWSFAEGILENINPAALFGIETEVLIHHVNFAPCLLVMFKENDLVEIEQRILECNDSSHGSDLFEQPALICDGRISPAPYGFNRAF